MGIASRSFSSHLFVSSACPLFCSIFFFCVPFFYFFPEVGNLFAGEILEQLVYANRFATVTNVVFMGMVSCSLSLCASVCLCLFPSLSLPLIFIVVGECMCVCARARAPSS